MKQQPTSEASKRSLLLGGLLVLAGLGLALAARAALNLTSSQSFCTSCHSMAVPFEEYQKSAHYTNRFGTGASCPDCHVPRDLGPLLKVKVMASRDLLHELLGTIDTPEQFEANRWRMANRVWDRMLATDSRECRACHAFDQADLDAQEHRTARKHMKAAKEGETCIVCHKGIVHKLPDPPATQRS